MQQFNDLRMLWETVAKLHNQTDSGARASAMTALLQLHANPDKHVLAVCKVYNSIARWAAQLQETTTLHEFVIELLSFAKTDRLKRGTSRHHLVS